MQLLDLELRIAKCNVDINIYRLHGWDFWPSKGRDMGLNSTKISTQVGRNRLVNMVVAGGNRFVNMIVAVKAGSQSIEKMIATF